MKKLLVLFASGLLSLTVMAQQSSLIGTWQLLDSNGFPTTSVKVFMPDGRLLGLSFSSDFSNSSVWYMSYYKVLSDSTYMEHVIYHSSIVYQCDAFFTYHQLNDSMRVTLYSTYMPNGHLSQSTGRWKKMNRPMPTYTDAEWQSLYQKSLAEFDRLPKAGQTVEQYAKELCDKYLSYKKANKLDKASEALLMRAELDTTNLEWQRDVLNFYLEYKGAPSVVEKIADRNIRLTEAKAAATDTSVVEAYRKKAYLYNYRGEKGRAQVREILSKMIEMETTAGHKPTRAYGLDYFLMAMTYLPQGEFATIYDYAGKAIDILEKAPDVSKKQLGEAYFLKGMALMGTDRHREAIDVLLEKVVPLFVDEQGQRLPKVNNDVLPLVCECYKELFEKAPKDKKLLKEYQQFMSDKLLYAVFEATNKEYNLWGEYIILENGSWTLEKPILVANSEYHMLLQKGDKYVDVEVKEDHPLGGAVHVVPVDAARKEEVIKQWKAYKKNKK